MTGHQILNSSITPKSCWSFEVLQLIHPPKIHSLPLKSYRALKGKDRLPTIRFSGAAVKLCRCKFALQKKQHRDLYLWNDMFITCNTPHWNKNPQPIFRGFLSVQRPPYAIIQLSPPPPPWWSKILPTYPWKIPQTLHQQFLFRNLFLSRGLGEVWGIFPGAHYVGKIIEMRFRAGSDSGVKGVWVSQRGQPLGGCGDDVQDRWMGMKGKWWVCGVFF